MKRHVTSSLCRLSGALVAASLLLVPPASGQVIPNCEIRVSEAGRLNNASTSEADLNATGSDSRLRLGRRVFFDDNTSVSGALVGLGNSSSVFNLNADTVQRGRGAVVRGDENPFSASDFGCVVPPVSCGGQNVVVSKNGSGNLSPGTYSLIDLANGASLTLAPGVYNVCEIRTGRNTTIAVTGAAQTTINVAGNVRLDSTSTLGSAGNTPTPLLNVLGDSVRFSANSIVRAFLQAPNARLALGRSAQFTGAACAQTLVGARNVELLCAPDTSTTTTTTTASTTTTTAATTTTTTESTTTTTASTTTTTTTTTLPPVQCCVPGSPMGAFACELLTTAECTAAGGTDLGPGTCDPDPCAATTTTTTESTTTTVGPTTTTTESTTTTIAPTTTTTQSTTTTTESTTTTVGPTTTTTESTTTTTASTTTTTTTPPAVQCCVPGSPMGAFACELLTTEECTAAGGTDLGPGTCDPDPCGATTTTTTESTTTTIAPTTTTTESTTTTIAPTTTTTESTTTTIAPTTTTTESTTTTTTTTSTTTTTTPLPTILDFATGVPGGTCGNTQNAAAGIIKNLTCGGLNIGGGGSIVPEGPTPDGSISRFALSCAGPACTISATDTVPPVNTAGPDCTTTGCNFGTPLPIPNPLIPTITTCVMNTWALPATGTLDLATGTSSTSVPLSSDIYLTGNLNQPCPRCSASGSPDSPGTGTCDRGPRATLACTTTSATGATRDCPTGGANPPSQPCTPGGGLCIDGSHVGVISVNLTPLTTGSASDTDPGGLFCPGQGAGQVGCFGSTLCRTITENGAPAGPITIGVPANATLASVFCIGATGNGLVDASANLPGPGAVSLPGIFVTN